MDTYPLPFPACVLNENREHSLHGSQNGAVDDHRPLKLSTRRFVLEIKALGQLKVELNRGALVFPLKCIRQQDINLGSVEGTLWNQESTRTKTRAQQ